MSIPEAEYEASGRRKAKTPAKFFQMDEDLSTVSDEETPVTTVPEGNTNASVW